MGSSLPPLRRLARFGGVDEDVVVGMVEVVGKAVAGMFAAFWIGHVGFGVVVPPCRALQFRRTRDEVSIRRDDTCALIAD